MEHASTVPQWNLSQKIAFRFIFIFFILFIIISNNGAFPLWNFLMKYPTEWLHTFIPWVGKHVLQLSYNITVFTNGSGDTTYDYVIVFTIAVVAAAGTIVWSLLDRKRSHYQTLYYWLTVVVRFYVGLMLIQYGLVKVVKLQFPDPHFFRLTQAYGDSSPMGLAWTFLGFSKGYNLFMGLAEVSAVLLLFRRTMTLGAIITLATTANVMAVNYFYDVPVKILSTALFVMTAFLLLHDAKRLWKFFITGRAVSLPVIKAPALQKKWLRIARVGMKVLIIGNALALGLYGLLEARKQYGDRAPKPALYGLYEVDQFIVNHDTLPPLTTDSERWDKLFIEWEGRAQVVNMMGNPSYFTTKVDTVSHTIELALATDNSKRYSCNYELPRFNKLNLTGVVQGDSVKVFTTRKDRGNFLLTNRGFHWINEYPFNR